MQARQMRDFISRDKSQSHPILVTGNIVEGLLGIVSIAGLTYTAFTFGWTWALVGSILYTVAVAFIALLSAYNLA